MKPALFAPARCPHGALNPPKENWPRRTGLEELAEKNFPTPLLQAPRTTDPGVRVPGDLRLKTTERALAEWHRHGDAADFAAATNALTFSKSLACVPALSVFVFASTPAGLTTRMASATLSGPSPPASKTGVVRDRAICRLTFQSCVIPSAPICRSLAL